MNEQINKQQFGLMLSTVFEQSIYLGFIDSQPLPEPTYQDSYLGGNPIFLQQPQPASLICSNCEINIPLTFLCQIFCPFGQDHSYNRVLYVLYCQKCLQCFRCIKQQQNQKFVYSKENHQKIIYKLHVLSQKSFKIQSQEMQIKQLTKLIKKCHLEVDEEVIEEKEQEEWDDEEDQQKQMKEYQEYAQKQKSKEVQDAFEKMNFTEEQIEGLKKMEDKEEKQVKDLVFEEYKKVMKELDNPQILYSNIGIPYNSQQLNPKHFCKFCKSKISLELQLTEKILLVNEKLLGMDWGSVMIYTCSDSCNESVEEQVIIQYELDAIKDADVENLKQSKKNKKKKERKNRSKNKKQTEHKGEIEVNQEKIDEKLSDEEGDWD